MDDTFVLYDRATESLWYPGEDDTLRAVAGAEQGRTIDFVVKPEAWTLAEWVRKHPDTTVLLPTEADAKAFKRPKIGLRFNRDREDALEVRRIVGIGPAAGSGIEVGDLLRSIAGRAVTSRQELDAALDELEGGQTVELELERAGVPFSVELTLRARNGG